MAYTDEIYARACSLLGGEAGPENTAALTAMCEAAGAELEARLRQGVSAQEIKKLFVGAAGVLALSMYIQLFGACDDTSSFKAGNVSVSRRGAGSVKISASAL
ncbi:MAG TPA: hypothetical protein GXZ52_06435, partial [Clostridiales bacterium]|nr:hypothetical protein [Clostridiales bacterium]